MTGGCIVATMWRLCADLIEEAVDKPNKEFTSIVDSTSKLASKTLADVRIIPVLLIEGKEECYVEV